MPVAKLGVRVFAEYVTVNDVDGEAESEADSVKVALEEAVCEGVAAVRVVVPVPMDCEAVFGVTDAEGVSVSVALREGEVDKEVLALRLSVDVPVPVGFVKESDGDALKLRVAVDVPVGCVRDAVAPEGVSVFFVNVRVA